MLDVHSFQRALCRYPGGLKERAAKDQHQKDPVKVLYDAVYGMLPKNKLRRVSLGIFSPSLLEQWLPIACLKMGHPR